MSVVTDTTNHENGGRGDSRIAPTGDWTGVVFRGIIHAALPVCTPRDENGHAAGTSNHKGCPYDRFAGAYFRTNVTDE